MVDGARFCHRCGRPVFEEPVEVAAETSPRVNSEPVAIPASELPVTLSNPIAIRVALFISPLTVLASVLPLVNVLFLVWWIAGGWFAANRYRRLTGSPITVNAGARLGWILGLLSFVGLSAVMAVTYTLMGKQIFDEMVKQNPQAAEVLNDPSAVVMALLVGLLIFFVAISGACAAGGALCARFGAKNTPAA